MGGGMQPDLQSNETARAMLAELRYIRWLLFAILLMLITFAVYTLPEGWWYRGWWSV